MTSVAVSCDIEALSCVREQMSHDIGWDPGAFGVLSRELGWAARGTEGASHAFAVV